MHFSGSTRVSAQTNARGFAGAVSDIRAESALRRRNKRHAAAGCAAFDGRGSVGGGHGCDGGVVLGVVIGAEAVVMAQPWDTHGVVSRSVREQGEPSQLCFIKRDVPRLLFSNLTRARPHTMTKKRKAEDPDAPPKPKWITPVDDPAWEPYMYECLYSGEEMFKASRVQLGPTKRLAWPFKTHPDRSKLSKNAEESLVRAIDIFEIVCAPWTTLLSSEISSRPTSVKYT
jgi:hypothetical protein